MNTTLATLPNGRPRHLQRFCRTTPAQQRVIGLIARGEDWGHHPDTLAALERKGLVVGRWETTGGRASVRIRRYHLPPAILAEWREWSAENLPDEAE